MERLGHNPPQFADPSLQFHDSECYLDNRFIPCVQNSNNKLVFENLGDANDYCMIGSGIEGHTPEGQFIPVGDPFHMDAGEIVEFTVRLHFNVDYWEETEQINMFFYAGYCVNPPPDDPSCTSMYIQDTITFATEVYVEDTVDCTVYTNQTDCLNAGCHWCNNQCQNTPCAGACETYQTEAECQMAGCYWYQKYIWENPSCHTQTQNMLMDYLPFIILGGGLAAVGVALAVRKKAPMPRPMYYGPPPKKKTKKKGKRKKRAPIPYYPPYPYYG